MIRKSSSGMATNRAYDFRIDYAARLSAEAVRAAGNDGATERFLSRFLDHLHTADNIANGLAPLEHPDPSASRRRRRRGV